MSETSIRNSQTGRGFNIADFKSYISSAGVMRNNHFLAIFPYPRGMLRTPDLITTERNLEFACDLFAFPSTGMHTYPVQRYSYGPVEMKPTSPKFSPLQCTFYCDMQTNVQRFFHEWVKTAVNFDFGEGSIVTATADSGAVPYEISYMHDYAVDIHLQMYDEHGNMVKEIRFREAWPTDVGDVVLSWGRQNEIAKIPVAFHFTDWSDVTTTGATG